METNKINGIESLRTYGNQMEFMKTNESQRFKLIFNGNQRKSMISAIECKNCTQTIDGQISASVNIIKPKEDLFAHSFVDQ